MERKLIDFKTPYLNEINTLNNMIKNLTHRVDKLEGHVMFLIEENIRLQDEYIKLKKQHLLVCASQNLVNKK